MYLNQYVGYSVPLRHRQNPWGDVSSKRHHSILVEQWKRRSRYIFYPRWPPGSER